MPLKRLSHILCIAAVAALFATVVFAGNGEKNDQRRDKARYFYLKGVVSEAEKKFDSAYEYYKKAFSIDPDYPDAGFSYGAARILLGEDTFASREELLKSISYMKKLTDTYPSDVLSGEAYAYYAGVADTLPEAVRVYEMLVKSHPGLSRLYFPQSYYYANLEKYDEAIQAVREYERLEGATTETMVRKVSYFLAKGDTLGALAEGTRYAMENAGSSQPIIDRALLYKLLEQKDSAAIILNEGLKEFPGNTDMMVDLALIYIETGDTARYYDLLETTLFSPKLEYDDKMEVLRISLRNINPKNPDFTKVEEIFRKSEKLYSDDPIFLDIYSDLYLLERNYDKMLEKSAKAYSLASDDPDYLSRFITASIIADKAKDGIKAFEDFGDPEVKKDYGLLMTYISAAQVANEYPKALAGIDTLLTTYIPVLNITSTLDTLTVDSLLLEYGPELMKIASVGYEIAGDIFSKQGKYEDAKRTYENSLNIDGDQNASALNNYAYFIIETLKAEPGSEDFKKAKEMSRKSLELTAYSPQSTYYDTFAWILFKEQNYKDALEYQELAIELAGADVVAELLSHYGDILFMNGRPEDAMKQWEKALTLDPQDTLLKKKVEHKTFFYE